MSRVLVTGAAGRLGTELTWALRKKYGTARVLATDILEKRIPIVEGRFEVLDVLDYKRLQRIIRSNKITHIYQLSAISNEASGYYSAKGWDLNIQSLLHILEISREENIEQVFWPSSIAVFGKGARKVKCEQHEVQNPSTTYGIGKSAGELWCNFYFEKYKVDVRSIRYGGLVSSDMITKDGTTDYAVDIYRNALTDRFYTCYLKGNTRLPMMYMKDAVRATLELMEAEAKKISVRTSYNVSAMDFTPAEIAGSIKERIEDFTIDYEPDYRQEIADSWPASVDDYYARRDWEWKPGYNLQAMTKEVLLNLSSRYINDYYGNKQAVGSRC